MIARNVRLEILRRAREILSVRDNWTTKHLRIIRSDGAPQYCVLGAIEQAAYDVGYAVPPALPFRDGSKDGLGFKLGEELSLSAFAIERHNRAVWAVNDGLGYGTTMRLLDDYITEVEEGTCP